MIYYCSQNGAEFGNHCKDKGMAGVVNQPDLTKLKTYQDAAALVNTSVTPDSSPFGGVFVANPDTDAVNGNSTSTNSTDTSSTSAAGKSTKITKAGCTKGALGLLLLSVFVAL